MEPAPLSPVVRRLVRALCRNPSQGVSDAELLRRFVGQRDEAAFELLVWRHERMVRSVCRRLLGREQDVEDAGQATFLTLACKAGSIGQHHALGGWLYKVAYRIALRLKADARKRGRREQGADSLDAFPAPGDAGQDAERHDLRAAVDEEISRLPEKYRTPVVLCYLEGKTNEEAAAQLGCPTGTVVTWLARARQRLRSRLERRGLAVTASGMAALVALPDVGSAAPPEFVQPTVKAALLFARDRTAAGLVSPRVAQLTKGALHAMFLDRLKIAAVLLLVVCLAGARPGILALEKLQTPPARPAAVLEQSAVVQPVLAVAPAGEQGKEKHKQEERKSERAKVQEVLTKSFKTGKTPTLVVEVFNGPVEVVADADGSVEAKVTKQSEAKTEEEARAGLKNIDVQMVQEKGSVRITARRIDPKRPGHESASAVLRVPAGAVLNLRTDNGSVKVVGGQNEAKVRTSNGAITVQDAKGSLNLQTCNGAIDVTGATGRVELKTDNGAIRLGAEKALVTAHTSNSAIRFEGTLANGKHEFTTDNGRIHLTLPAEAQFRVDAQTSNGTIVDEFSDSRARGHGTLRLNHVTGNNPRVSLRLRTGNGAIEIQKK